MGWGVVLGGWVCGMEGVGVGGMGCKAIFFFGGGDGVA